MFNFLKKITVILLLAAVILFLKLNIKNEEHIDFNRNSIETTEQETIILDCEIKKGFLSLELQGFLYTNKDNFKFNLKRSSYSQIKNKKL